MFEDIVIIRGGGDIASGIAHRLHRSGFKILMLEVEKPTMIRRKVSFATVIYEGEIIVEDVKAIKANNLEDVYRIWKKECIPVIIDSKCSILKDIKADILIDARLAKTNLGINKDMASITIGIGPGFKGGEDVDVVIESYRGHDLGRLIFKGYAKADTGIPGEIEGYSKERVLKAPCNGIIRNLIDIGNRVKKGQIVAYVDNEPVRAQIDGVVRGLIMSGLKVKRGFKIGDIDPRGIKEYCFTISDKARAIAGSVVEAILYLKNKNGV